MDYLKNLPAKRRISGRDAGASVLSTVVGIALGAIVIATPTAMYISSRDDAAATASLEKQNTAISHALNTASQQLQVADPVLYAAKNSVTVKRSATADGGEKDANNDGTAVSISRWTLKDGVLYEQVWLEKSDGTVNDGWEGNSLASGNAGDVTRKSVTGVADLPDGIFSYFDSSGTEIDVSTPLPVGDPGLNKIRRVDINLEAATVRGGVVQNATSVALRNNTGTVAGPGTATAVAACPPFTITDNAGTPVITWQETTGAASYRIYRNTTAINGLTIPASATEGTWTDPAVSAADGAAYTYRVLGIKGDGTPLSSNCAPKTFRSPIASPVWQASGVEPADTEAAAWTGSPLTAPRINLNWGAVQGAASYELFYREVDPATGTPLVTAFTAVPDIGTDTSYIWDGGGWGKRYEWYVQANAQSSVSAQSAFLQTLTHPTAPDNTTVSAAYGTGTKETTHGVNTVTWDAVPTATTYEVWRYNTGTSGTVTKVYAGAATSFADDSAPYGSTFSYWVAAKNAGPRGVDASGAVIDEARSSATPESAVDAANKPDVVTQLQYPPIPGMTQPSLTGTVSRDLEGINRTVWNAAASADGYLVWRVAPVTGQATCLTAPCDATGDGVTATQFEEPAPRGTQRGYAVKAVNDTGVSVKLSTVVELTQRPATPVITVTDSPDLTSNAVAFKITANADSGNDSANRFCTSTTCSYDLKLVAKTGFWSDGSLMKINHPGTDLPVTWSGIGSPHGHTATWAFRTKNEALTNGGYSNVAGKAVNAYPGKFPVTGKLGWSDNTHQARFRLNVINNDYAGSSQNFESDGYTNVAWGPGAGTSSMDVERHTIAGGTTSTNTSLGLPSATLYHSRNRAAKTDTLSWVATPGSDYRYYVTAVGYNGWERTLSTSLIQTPSDLPRHGKTILTCAYNTWSDQTTARYDHPNHKIGSRLIDYDPRPRYGTYAYGNAIGLSQVKGGGLYQTNSGNFTAAGSIMYNGPGNGYFYGIHSGFDAKTVGANGNPNSLRLRLSLVSYATFNGGCGPYGGTWGQLAEPVYACYGYVPGQPCATNSPQNRPQWSTQ